MPVTSLPLELVALVVTELRLSCGDDDEARSTNGLNIALVCKAWQSLGGSLVWRRLTLETETMARRAVKHFQAYPHLLVVLRELRIGKRLPDCFPGGPAEEPALPQPGPDSLENQIAGWWASSPVLETVELFRPPWLDLEPLFPTLSSPPNFRCLALHTSINSRLSAARVLQHLPSFTSLVDLDLSLGAADLPPIPSPSSPTICLRNLSVTSLDFERGPDGLLMRLLDLMDPATLV
ncbi:hypothetical protein JCM10213_005079 [Rhodosporidiobolus nylandii]